MCGNASAGRTADLDGLESPALLESAADSDHDFLQFGAHGHFDQPAPDNFPGQGKAFRSRTPGSAHRPESGGTASKDPRYGGKSFNVVHQCRTAEEALLRNQREEALYHTGKAEKLLPDWWIGWLKAQDILQTTPKKDKKG